MRVGLGVGVVLAVALAAAPLAAQGKPHDGMRKPDKQQSGKADGMAPGAMAKDSAAPGAMGTDAMGHDSMSSPAMGKDAMSHDAMGRDSMGGGDAMGHDAMGGPDGAMHHDAMAAPRGTFAGAGGRRVSGSFTVIAEGGRSRIRLSDDFSLPQADDVYLVLTSGTGAPGNGSVNLGELARPSGAQAFDLPAGTDLAHFDRLVLWSKKDKAVLASAELAERGGMMHK